MGRSCAHHRGEKNASFLSITRSVNRIDGFIVMIFPTLAERLGPGESRRPCNDRLRKDRLDYARYRVPFRRDCLIGCTRRGSGQSGTHGRSRCGNGIACAQFANRGASDLHRYQSGVADRSRIVESSHARSVSARGRTLDVITAAQCWHWFDRQWRRWEIFARLRPGGSRSSTRPTSRCPRASPSKPNKLILRHRPSWRHANSTGINGQVSARSSGQRISRDRELFVRCRDRIHPRRLARIHSHNQRRRRIDATEIAVEIRC